MSKIEAIADAPTPVQLALRPRDAAKALGLSPRKLWSITADTSSGIPFIKLGKVILYPRRQLEEWLTAKLEGKP